MTDHKRMHQQLLDMLGAKDQVDAARIIAGFQASRLSQGAQVSGNSGELADDDELSSECSNDPKVRAAYADGYDVGFAHGKAQGAQGEAVGEIDCLVACRRLQTLVEEYEHGETGETFGDKEWLVHDFIAGSDVWSIFESLYAHPAERAAVPDGWKTEFERLLEDYVGACSEAAVWNSTQSVQPIDGVRFPKPRLARLMEHVNVMLTAAPQPPEGARVVDDWEPSDEEVRAWMERNDLSDMRLHNMRTAIDDARSMHLLAAPTLAGKEGAK